MVSKITTSLLQEMVQAASTRLKNKPNMSTPSMSSQCQMETQEPTWV